MRKPSGSVLEIALAITAGGRGDAKVALGAANCRRRAAGGTGGRCRGTSAVSCFRRQCRSPRNTLFRRRSKSKTGGRGELNTCRANESNPVRAVSTATHFRPPFPPAGGTGGDREVVKRKDVGSGIRIGSPSQNASPSLSKSRQHQLQRQLKSRRPQRLFEISTATGHATFLRTSRRGHDDQNTGRRRNRDRAPDLTESPRS